jgi:hypothetical protein
MMQFAAHDGDSEEDALTSSQPRPAADAAREALLHGLSVLFFVMLGLVVIVATVKSHLEYKQAGTSPFFRQTASPTVPAPLNQTSPR